MALNFLDFSRRHEEGTEKIRFYYSSAVCCLGFVCLNRCLGQSVLSLNTIKEGAVLSPAVLFHSMTKFLAVK
jgi:hypothetical protein